MVEQQLTVSALKVVSGKKVIISSCSFACPHPAIVVVLGKNGAGKSSLLRALGKLVPSEGKVALPRSVHPHVPSCSFLPQDLSFERGGGVTVEEFLRIAHPQKLRLRSPWDTKRIESELRRYGLQHIVGRRLEALSGGERRLLLILATFLIPSPVALLDEPTNHLDIDKRLLVARILLDESRRGVRTSIIATHDLLFALAVADNLLLLEQGETICYGPIKEVMKTREFTNRYGGPCEVRLADGTHRHFPEATFEPLLSQ